jgi:ketosteroid isomerase-like protein
VSPVFLKPTFAEIKQRTGNGVTKKGHAYHNEYIFIFKFEGGKIVNMKEFIDVKAFEGVVAAETRQ